MNKRKGVYCVNDTCYDLSIYFNYSYDSGDWIQPPSEDVDVYKVELNDEDITDFYFDYMSVIFEDQVLEFALQDH